jgi:hypothetical protein
VTGVLMPIPLDGDTGRWLSRHPEESEAVRRFVALMVIELRANDVKGNRPGWLTMDRKTAIAEVHWHASKLAVAAKDLDSEKAQDLEDCDRRETLVRYGDPVREFAADVANCALMVLDCMRLLDMPEPAEPFDPDEIAPHIHDGRESL